MAHKLKIELEYTDPKIYRTVIVPEHFTFNDLHIVIQCVMNWNNSHLYQFNIGQAYASDSIRLLSKEDNEFENVFRGRFEKYDATQTFLTDFFNGQKKKMRYIYDFGDDWRHIIKVFKRPKEEVLMPKCIKGENVAPIDDCGSYPGFYDLMEISTKKRKTKEEKEMLEWYGIPNGKSYKDVYGFDMDEVNKRLLKAFKNN